jgi:hypothetical protein
MMIPVMNQGIFVGSLKQNKNGNYVNYYDDWQ